MNNVTQVMAPLKSLQLALSGEDGTPNFTGLIKVKNGDKAPYCQILGYTYCQVNQSTITEMTAEHVCV